MKKTFVGLVALVVLVLGLWAYAEHVHAPVSSRNATQSQSATSSASESTSTAAIPGDNLTLGEDKNASGAYLIGYNGMAVYTYDADTANASHCTGACAFTWSPYVVTSTSNLVAEYPVDGKISTIAHADGKLQVTYNGHPLYFYTGDLKAEDTNGDGKDHTWHLARP
jgi:predicted lipoprotein with Yx(FWY)xxD motif